MEQPDYQFQTDFWKPTNEEATPTSFEEVSMEEVSGTDVEEKKMSFPNAFKAQAEERKLLPGFDLKKTLIHSFSPDPDDPCYVLSSKSFFARNTTNVVLLITLQFAKIQQER